MLRFWARVFAILIFSIAFCHTNATPIDKTNKIVNNVTNINNKNQNSLSITYSTLLEDIRWFCGLLEDISSIAERLLPNVTPTEETRSLSENTRLGFLLGLRHVFAGVKEISVTIRKGFAAEQMQQLESIVQATNVIHDALRTLKIWLSSLRALFGQLLHMYNRNLPEILLGKCLGRYIVAAYPDSAFYEYPFLLLNDIYNTISKSMKTTPSVEISNNTDDVQVTTENIPTEQNEIPHYEQDDYELTIKGRSFSEAEIDYNESFFDFSDIIEKSNDALIESAVKKHSWQKCFKMYTAETIARKLKLYFLNVE